MSGCHLVLLVGSLVCICGAVVGVVGVLFDGGLVLVVHRRAGRSGSEVWAWRSMIPPHRLPTPVYSRIEL